MQIRCNNCHKPFALSKEAIHSALDQVNAEDLGYYGAPCPHCRRVNRISRQELQRAAPDWQGQSSERSPNG
jgi:phage FluMu protein Com